MHSSWLLLSLLLTLAGVQEVRAQRQNIARDSNFIYTLALDSVGEECTVRSITITRRGDGTDVQTIIPDDNSCSCDFPPEQLFIVEDVDFDGHNDISLMQFLPAAPNVPYYFWVYRPSTGRFERELQLEEITSPEFDRERKLVTSFWRSSCCDHGLSIYRYIRGKITLIEEFEDAEDLQKPGYIIRTRKKLVKGRMKMVEWKREKMAGDGDNGHAGDPADRREASR